MTQPLILIVDDHVDSADVFGLLMEMQFPESAVAVTYRGREALALASERCPDVAFLDMEMPEMDGEALALALRAMFPEKPPLLIALSGNVDRLDGSRHSGVFDLRLSKPVDVDVVVRMIGKRLAWSCPGLDDPA